MTYKFVCETNWWKLSCNSLHNNLHSRYHKVGREWWKLSYNTTTRDSIAYTFTISTTTQEQCVRLKGLEGVL